MSCRTFGQVHKPMDTEDTREEIVDNSQFYKHMYNMTRKLTRIHSSLIIIGS
jgi:hypothetical protein